MDFIVTPYLLISHSRIILRQSLFTIHTCTCVSNLKLHLSNFLTTSLIMKIRFHSFHRRMIIANPLQLNCKRHFLNTILFLFDTSCKQFMSLSTDRVKYIFTKHQRACYFFPGIHQWVFQVITHFIFINKSPLEISSTFE